MKYTIKDNILDTLKVVFISSLVLGMGLVFGDVVSEPIQIIAGATPAQIKEASNIEMFRTNILLFVLTISAVGVLSFFMLGYLNGRHSEAHYDSYGNIIYYK